MDALGGVVGDELGGGAAGVELDLVDGRDDLKGTSVVIVPRQRVSLGERGEQRTLHEGSFSSLSRCVIPKLETPMFFTLPVSGSFCISLHVSR